MCGIVGFFDGDGRIPEDVLPLMMKALVHRGPDDSGFLAVNPTTGATTLDGLDGDLGGAGEPRLMLGHQRLSILDLTARGRQPMRSASGRSWIVHNGEVYNYLELRRTLEGLGYSFRTETDTEVILAAYEEWGRECLSRFNGMFSFAVWDGERRELFCARDRMGIKPLYYFAAGPTFVFASEIKGLLQHPGVPRKPNRAVIHDYLMLGLVDHTEETFFHGVRRLPAGHFCVFKPADGCLREPQRWWDVEVSRELFSSPTASDEWVHEYRSLFEDAVRLRLRSDVAVGTCLSGGIDSSSIVMMIDSLLRSGGSSGQAAEQRTFSACFEDPRFDERPFINRINAAINAENQRVFPSGESLWDDLPSMLRSMDEPFQSTSQYSQWNVMKLVSESGVTVTLDGQGADELMAGYPGYHSVFLTTLARRGRWLSMLSEGRATHRFSDRGRSLPDLLLRSGYGLLPAGLAVKAREHAGVGMGRRLGSEAWTRRALSAGFLGEFRERREAVLRTQASNLRDLASRLYDDVFRFSLPALLRYEDRNSMAFSIEARTPFLDHRLVELLFSIPADMKLRGGWTKWILRQAMSGLIPEEVAWRKDKMGFVTPEEIWLRNGAAFVRDLFADGLASSEFVDQRGIGDFMNQAFMEEVPIHRGLWRFINVEMWMREFF